MSFVKDFLFGSKGTPSQVVDITPEQFEALRGPLAEALSAQFQNPQQFTGEMVAGMSPAEQQMLQQMQSFQLPQNAQQGAIASMNNLPQINAPGSQFQQGALQQIMQGGPQTAQQMAMAQLLGGGGGPQAFQQNALQQLQSGPQAQLLQQTLGGQFLSPDSNPFLAATIDAAQRPILEQFGDETAAMRAMFQRAGHTAAPQGSSPFDMARARLASGTANALGDVGTQIAGANYQMERGAQQNAIQQAMAGMGLGANIEQGMGQQGMQQLLAAAGIEQGLSAQQLQSLGLGANVEQGMNQQQLQAALGQGQQQIQAAQTGANIEQGMGQQQLQQMMANLEAQALPRLIEQMGLDRGLQEFQRQQAQLLQSLGIAGGLAAPTAATLPGTAGSPGALSGLLGGLGQGFGQQLGAGGG